MWFFDTQKKPFQKKSFFVFFFVNEIQFVTETFENDTPSVGQSDKRISDQTQTTCLLKKVPKVIRKINEPTITNKKNELDATESSNEKKDCNDVII